MLERFILEVQKWRSNESGQSHGKKAKKGQQQKVKKVSSNKSDVPSSIPLATAAPINSDLLEDLRSRMKKWILGRSNSQEKLLKTGTTIEDVFNITVCFN